MTDKDRIEAAATAITLLHETTALIRRQALELLAVKKLIEVATAAGWTIPSVFDGEDTVNCENDQDIIDTVFSVDECHIRVCKAVPGEKEIRQSVSVVLGNDGWDAFADYSTAPLFLLEVMDPVAAYCDKLDLRAGFSSND